MSPFLSKCLSLTGMQTRRRYCLTQSKSQPWKILFLGTDDFSLPHLQAVHNRYERFDVTYILIIEALTFSCAVGKYAMQAGIQGHVWPYVPQPGAFDVGVVASFGHLLPAELINAFPHGILNVHPSLLPKFRGSAPINHTILSGDSVTGVSIMQIAAHRFDVGPLLLQEKCNIEEGISATELRSQLSSLGSKMLLHALSDLHNLEKEAKVQSEVGVSKAPKIKLKHARVNWERQTPRDIDRQYRAVGTVHTLQSEWQGQVVKMDDMVPLKEFQPIEKGLPSNDVPCGTPLFHIASESLCIKCRDGWVAFRQIVFKKQMSAKDFSNGYISSDRNHGETFQSHENGLRNYFENNTIAEREC
ncbi:hypothetical protein CAPTEDRAFT_167871 [Capitella teleta]|uniref:Methionyl-tRNA formyltransferase, mitochondrial n=1 Tax=Capitella teleta TaxID=283909 RepID=R7VA75_CAPTE|nr:hypothetical protein CAPTEDRAFT_167871 [Capitella teleta]|eukprot:ELU13226.1 hypothetical protein CAPTEDRAFT_167871 [Capitella teleta]